MKKLVVINGHPDPRPERFCAALAAAYRDGGEAGGWNASLLDAGALPLSAIAGLRDDLCDDPALGVALKQIDGADRLAVIYPLWFGRPPESLRAIFSYLDRGGPERKAHVIVTMDMPAFAYRQLAKPEAEQKQPMLDLAGVILDEPVLIGCVQTISAEQRQHWLETMYRYGERTALGSMLAPPRTGILATALDRTASWWAAL